MKRGIRREDRHIRRLNRRRASNYIRAIEEVTQGDKVVLCCRVSRRHQRKAGNLGDQEADLRKEAATRGAMVADVVRHTGSGANPTWLSEATAIARRHGAKLLAETTSRFIRHPEYHSEQRPAAQAGWNQLEALRFCTHGATLVTVLHADANWRDERAYHTKRGQRQKVRRGGRPRKAKCGATKERRLRALAKVRWMKCAGLSNRAIAKLLKTSESNVRRWGAPFLRRNDFDDYD